MNNVKYELIEALIYPNKNINLVSKLKMNKTNYSNNEKIKLKIYLNM